MKKFFVLYVVAVMAIVAGMTAAKSSTSPLPTFEANDAGTSALAAPGRAVNFYPEN